MSKPEEGKHARAKERVKAAVLVAPAVLTSAAVAFTVAAYQPLVYDPDSIAHVAQAQASELQTAEATSERQTANNPVIESNFGMDIGTLNDGTYTGSARGYKSVITVQVTIVGGKISAITVVSEGDDEPYFRNARAVIQRVLASQSMNVDTVSGCTYSSTGILMAIKNALLQAAGKAPEAVGAVPAQTGANHAPATDIKAPTGTMKDGIYTGSGMGFNDYITVSITVQGGKIASISIMDQGDDEPYFTNAKNGVLTRILTSQNSKVDAVSGATYSSKGIMAAVADAMKKAVAANSSAAGDADNGSGGGKGDATDPSKPGGSGGTDTPGTDSSPNPDPSNPDNPSNPGDAATPHYEDGSYTAYVYCADTSRPTRYEPYYLAATVNIKDGKVASITNVHGQSSGNVGDAELNPYDEDNDIYIAYAVEGRTYRNKTYLGVVNQLLKGTKSSAVDVVGGATYSSKALARAYDAALAQAEAAYKEKHPEASSGTDVGQGSPSTGSEEGAAAGASAGGSAMNGSGSASASALNAGSVASAREGGNA